MFANADRPHLWPILGSVAMGALAVGVVLWPVLFTSELMVLGHPEGEALAHLWGLEVAAEGVLRHGPFLRVSALVNAPEGFSADLIDPVHVLPFWVLRALTGHGARAWALLPALWTALGALGAHRLARRMAVSPTWLVAAWVLSPAWLGALVPAGRSEYWAWMAWPLVLSLSMAAADQPSKGRVLRAGLAWALVALGGWPALVLGAPWMVMLGALTLRERRQALVWLAVVVLGALLCVPALWVQLSHEPWWLERLAAPSPFSMRPLGTDPSGLWTGIPADTPGDRGPSVVPPLLLLAVVAAFRRPRVVVPWLLVGLCMLVAAVGPAVRIGDTDYWAPWAVVLHGAPALRGLHGWPRLATLAVLPLAIGVGKGFQRLPVGAIALVAVWGIGVAGGPATPLPTDDGVVEGPVLDLVSLDATIPEQAVRQRALADAVLWRRLQGGVATSLAPSTPRLTAAASFSLATRRLTGWESPVSARCAQEEAARLVARGFRAVVWHGGHSSHPRAADLMRDLGPPAMVASGWMWTLDPQTPAPRDCPLLSEVH